MDKILKMLGIEKLDESKQTDVKAKLDEIVDLKVQEKLQEKTEELKTTLNEEYQEKFEEYKTDITDKFSSFLDTVIDEEMEIPEKVLKYAKLGEDYEELVEMFKSKLAIDEDRIDEETKKLLEDCKTEIGTLKEEVNELTKEKMKHEHNARKLAAGLYLEEKCDTLTLKQAERVKKILEGITSQEEIDRKFEILVESLDEEGNEEDKSKEELDEEKKETEGKGKEELDEETKIGTTWMDKWKSLLDE